MSVCTKSVHHGWSEGACTWCEEPAPAAPKHDHRSVEVTFDGRPLVGAPTARFNVARERPHSARDEIWRIIPEAPNARPLERRYAVGVDYGGYSSVSVMLLGRGEDMKALAVSEDLVERVERVAGYIREGLIAAFDEQLVDSFRQTSAEAERMAREMERSAMWLRFSRLFSERRLVVMGDGS